VPVVLFNSRVLNGARANLRAASHIRDAAVDIGGYHFESGARDFSIWSRIVTTELELELIGTKFAGMALDLSDVYFLMRERAFERAREIAKTHSIDPAEVSESLNAFLKISKPPAQYLHLPPASSPATKPSLRAKQSNPEVTSNASSTLSARESAVKLGGVHHLPQNGSPLESLLAELRSHIGLGSVKKAVEELANSIRIDRDRQAQGLRVADRSLHMVFYGNPGTGKTTVARLVAQIYKELGVLNKGHLVCTDRAGLVANYVGQTASQVTSVVHEALGGVLFIDEAYSLAPPDSRNDFGQEAIQQLLLLMENHRNELVVIVAGYPDEMARFLDANPGLNSRFTGKLHFEDYSPGELVQIFEKLCGENDYRLQDHVREKLLQTVQTAHNHRDRTFGNARFVRNLFEEATKNLANRIAKSGRPSDRSALMLITTDDIPKVDPSMKSSRSAQHLPDLGKYLASKGIPQKTALVYMSWELDELAIVGRGRFCTTRVQPEDGNLYCATFDFGDEILGKILARAPTATRTLVAESLAEDPESVRRLRIPNPINVGIVATLGNLQQSLHELFIPLVITEVFGDDPAATLQKLGIDPRSGEPRSD